jgi:demethylspheroidene O-methyltransferase
VKAAISLRLLSHRSAGRVGLGMLGVAMHTDPGIAAMVQHHGLLYRDLADPVALLRGESGPTELSKYWAYARAAAPGELAAGEVGHYSALMATSQSFIARDVLDAYPFARHARLLDVGGGEGAFAMAAASRVPALDLMLFDLPAVAERARQRIAAAGLAARIVAHGGSFRTDPLPTGADVITLVRVLHDQDDAVAAALLRAIHAALPVGGTVVIAEPMAGIRGAEPVGDAYFGLYLFAMGSGRPRTQDEIRAMLSAAGFSGTRSWATRRPILASILSAVRS